MIEITDLLSDRADDLSEAFALGFHGQRHPNGWARADEAQRAHGLLGGTRRLLTDPEAQHKLAMGSVPSYGLTLHHHRMKSRLGALPVLNACPSAGDCTRLCVVGNNHGTRPEVQAAWRWRTDLLTHYPEEFANLLGYELRRAARDEELILFRPNVNSDIEWEIVIPALVDGSVMGDQVKLYGYTKHDSILHGNGWVTPHYRVAYSWNESSDGRRAAQHLARGGAVAVVTDRRYTNGTREPIRQWSADPESPIPSPTTRVANADVTDEWMFEEGGVIGDLAFKPRNRELAEWGRHTDFVVKLYHPPIPGLFV